MTNSNRLESANERVEELTAALSEARVEATVASAAARAAKKSEMVEAARTAAAAKQRVSDISAELKKAETEVKEAAKEKKAKTTAREAETNTAADQDNPFAGAEINWSLIGKWVVSRFRDGVCFVEGTGWGDWTGTHWEFSLKPSARLMDKIRAGWSNVPGTVTEKLNAGPKSALYALEHAQGALTLNRAVFNSPEVAHLLAFQNTTVDLRTGARVPHSPRHYMTGSMQCDYNENADAKRIEETFARFWPGDAETARCFQLALGYSLTAEISAKRIPMLLGNQDDDLKNGDNGKSLVQNAVVRMFGLGQGGWGSAVKSGLVVDTGDRDANSHDGAKAPLIWRRFAMSTEVRRGASIDSGEFNRVCGGDVQSARPPHGTMSVEFVNFATVWMSMNTSLRFKTWDKATRRRILAFPFNETFHDAEDCPAGGQVKELGLDLWLGSPAGQEALALYAVRGAVAFYEQNGGKPGNLPESDAMSALRDKILRTSNPFAEFFEDFLEFDGEWDTEQSAIKRLLSDIQGPLKPWEKDLFGSALRGMGVVPKTIRGARYYRGVRLSPKGLSQARMSGNQAPCIRRSAVSAIAAE